MKYFSATWCGPCKVFKPVMNEIAGEGYHVEFMDIDKTTFDEGLDNWINMYKATGKTEEKKMVSTIQNNNWISVNYSPATPTLALIFDRGHGIFFRPVDTWWEYHILRKFSHVVTTMLKIRVLIFKSHVLIVKLIRC